MFNKIAQLILTPGKNANTWSDIYIAQPDADKEELAGKLFALVETGGRTADDLKVINFIISELEHDYYQSEKLILRERAKTIKIEHIFEAALAKTNKSLLDFVREEKIKFDPYNLNAVVGILYNNELHFASIGKNKAFLIFKNKEQDIQTKNSGRNKTLVVTNQPKYKVVNIIDRTAGDERFVVNESKIFSSVISGAIPPGGYIVYTNEALSEYLSSRQLIDIVTTLPPMSAVEQMKNILSQINAYVSFLAIIIKNTTGVVEEEVRMASVPASTSQSIRSMNAMEAQTEKLLSPGGYVNVKNWLKGMTGRMSPKRETPDKPVLAPDTLKDKIVFRRKSFLLSLTAFFTSLKNIVLKIFALVAITFKTLADRQAMAALITGTYRRIADSFSHFGNWVRNLSLRNKIIILVAVVFLVLAAQNIIIKSWENKTRQEDQAVTAITTALEQKQNQVEANFIYGNEDAAKKLLAEIKDLLTKLPKDENGGPGQYAVFFQKYDEQLAKIRHVENLVNLSLVADFSQADPAANPANIILLSDSQDKLYASDQTRKTIYSVDTATASIGSIGISGNVKYLAFPSVDKNNAIYYLDTNSIVAYNPKNNKVNALSINLSGARENVSGAGMFNNKLYTVDKQDGQIYVYAKEATAFGAGQKWLKNIDSFSDASSIYIDGNVYVMKTDGELYKYLKGEKENFTLDAVEPAINSSAKVFVANNSSGAVTFIYVLEPGQKRLMVFDGDGKFKTQYVSDKFTDLKDFAVNEKTKTIYFLDGNKIVKSPAKHL